VIAALEMLGLEEPVTSERRLQSALTVLKRNLLGDLELARIYESHLLITGHRVLRIAPLKPGGAILFRELLDIVHLQGDLVEYGIVLRGAVTLGQAAGRADTVVGPGLEEATRLRDELAEVPRVIVDPRLLVEVENNASLRAENHDVLTELGFIRSLLRADSDGQWFVDYLKAFATELDEPSMYPLFLLKHRRLIEKRLKVSTVPSRSSKGWTWLWRYHNKAITAGVKEQRLKATDREKLRLTPPGSPVLYVFPPSTRAPP
jgi:hypothetical protein